MRCNNCYTEIDETVDYCPECGTPVIKQNPPDVSNGGYGGLTPPVGDGKKPADKNKIMIAVIAVLSVIVVAVVIVLIVLLAKGNSGSSSNSGIKSGDCVIDNYIVSELVCEGTNGAASVSQNTENLIDFEKMYTDMRKNSEECISYERAYEVYLSAIKVDYPNRNDLKNDDSVDVTIRVNYESINAKDYGFGQKLKGDEEVVKTFVIRNLTDKVNIDPYGVIKKISYNQNNSKTTVLYDEAFEKAVGDYTVEYNSSSNSKLSIKNSDDDEVATVSFVVDYSAGDTAKIEAIVDKKSDDSNYTVKTDPITKSVSITYKKVTAAKKAPVNYKFIDDSGDVSSHWSDYERIKSYCTKKRRSVNPDAEFVCSYFVLNYTYLNEKCYDKHAVNGLNFVYYIPSQGVYKSCRRFNLISNDGYMHGMSVGKYTDCANGNSSYSDPYDEYTESIRYSGSEKNWDVIEMIE